MKLEGFQLCLFVKTVTVILLGLLIVTLFIEKENLFPNKLKSSLQNRHWEREINLSNTVFVKWNITQDEMIMLVTGKTKGYVGVGFSYSKDMIGADIVIGGIADGEPFIQDCHATENGRPIIDQQQDYVLINANQNDTHTEFAFRRKLNTCDDKDIKISMDTMHLIWAIGEELVNRTSNLTQDSFSYHGLNRGSSNVYFLDKQIPETDFSALDSYDLLFDNVTVSVEHSFYWFCSVRKIPNFGSKHHVIGFESLITPGNERYVHHILLYLCRNTFMTTKLDEEKDHVCYIGSFFDAFCRKEIGGIAVGIKKKYFPPDFGIDFGSSSREPMYVLLEIHYDIGNLTKEFQDSSGLRIYHTAKRRKTTFSTMNVLAKMLQVIPPKQTRFSSFGICAEKCMKKILPSDGIHVIGFQNHAHTAAKAMIFHQYRDGVEIRRISDEHYDFNYQVIRFLKEEFLVLPNDVLAIECVYNTQDRNSTTFTGLDSKDEMCLLILLHYPPINSHFCWSVLAPEEMQKVFPQTAILDPNKNSFFYLQYMQVVFLYTNLINHTWTENETRLLTQLSVKGKQVSFCNNKMASDRMWSTTYLTNYSVQTTEDICSKHQTMFSKNLN